jgi:catechol 2,3-dioxygenase-like lactoylglutathione lyase family enzyme
MLGDRDAVANLAVKDLEAGRRFYRDTLGLQEVGREGEELVVFKSGNSTLNVYRSRYAGTNQATAVTWDVGERLEDVVRQLKAKGVTQGDIHVFGRMKVTWFKDPDDNILNVVGR